ncbi:MAG: hypothetical protein GY820_39350 [Gammaproteobacteria bacterium]|nr:hypothetical protein [Gammaproteobacteria bacterium]
MSDANGLSPSGHSAEWRGVEPLAPVVAGCFGGRPTPHTPPKRSRPDVPPHRS